MGQSQSQSDAASASASAINETDETSNQNSNSDPQPQPSSMESLLEEAAAYGDSEDESIEAKAQKALECPCIADLRKGTCGSQFSEAFLCFLKSTAEEKGSDCVHPFVALQSCIKANPDAFPKDTMADDQANAKDESPAKSRLHPPTWALESSSLKPRL